MELEVMALGGISIIDTVGENVVGCLVGEEVVGETVGGGISEAKILSLGIVQQFEGPICLVTILIKEK